MRRLDRLRALAARNRPAPPASPPDMPAIVARVDALEAMVEGLQDAVDRLATRHDERLDELARRLQPSELARALSEDSRRRGL